MIGATGRVGRPAVGMLLANGAAVRALSRDPADSGLPAEVEVVAGSPADERALGAAFAGVDGAIVVLAGDVPAQAANVAAAASAAGVGRLVFLSSIAVQHRLPHPNQVKHQLAEEPFRRSGVPTTFLRPGPFHSNALWWAGSIGEERRATSLMGNYPIASIDPADIAAVGAAVLCGERFAADAYALSGGEAITPEQQVDLLAELLGEEIEFAVADAAEATEAYGRMTGGTETAAENVRALQDPRSPWVEPLPTVLELTGRPPRSFREWAAANLERFAGAG